MQRPSPSNNTMPPVVSGFLIAFGGYLAAIATQLLPDPSTSPGNAPNWVLFLTGMVCIVSGILSMLKDNSKQQLLFVALLAALMGSLGLWATLAPAETMSGGIPFIPKALNVLIGRMLFGSGVIVSFWMSGYAIKTLIKSR